MAKNIIEKINKLPKELQDTLVSEDVVGKITAIGKNYDLSLEQVDDLYEKTNEIILGEARPENYIKGLQDTLNISSEKAKEVAKEVNEQIFAPIRESLKQVHGLSAETQKTAKPAETSESKYTGIKKPSPFEERLDKEKPYIAKTAETRDKSKYPDDTDPYKEPAK